MQVNMNVPRVPEGAILYDVSSNASQVLAHAGHPRGNVSSGALRNNLRDVLVEDLNYSFNQQSVYSKPTTRANNLAEARTLHLHGINNPSRTRDLSWITIRGACNYAAAEITYM